MNLKSSLITLLMALAAYLLFALQWTSTYIKAWYGNIPEETQYLRLSHFTNPYVYYGWMWGVSFLLFLIAGITSLFMNKPNRFLNYGLMLILFFSSYYTFLFAADFPKWSRTGSLNFVILCLLGISISRLYLTLPAPATPGNIAEQ